MDDAQHVHHIIRDWERRRVLYNGVLLLVGVVLLFAFLPDLRRSFDDGQMLVYVGAVALVANLAYFLGPLIELYTLVYIGRRWPPGVRVGVFAAGLLFSALMFVGIALAGSLVGFTMG